MRTRGFAPRHDLAVDLAFNKARADDRKTWLQGHSSADIVIPHADRRLLGRRRKGPKKTPVGEFQKPQTPSDRLPNLPHQ